MLKIKTFGGLSVQREGSALAGAAAQPRRLAILAILARHGARGFSRDKLVSLLWPDVDEERARKNLAQALYALRRDLGSDEAITGVRELALDPAIASADVSEFEDALARGDIDRAVELHVAPFLDGVHVSGSAEFERWAEVERADLQQKCTAALLRMAQRDAERGDQIAAALAWRRLAGADPLNPRIAMGLMRALAASGDVAGALNHARVYEVLAMQDLDLPLDREIVEFARQLRESPPAPEVSAPVPVAATHPVAPVSTSPSQPVEAVVESRPAVVGNTKSPPAQLDLAPTGIAADAARRETPFSLVALPAMPVAAQASRTTFWRWAAAMVVLVSGLWFAWTRIGAPHRPATMQVLAIGRLTDRSGDSTGVAGSLGDLLATNLARVDGVRVVSAPRMLELLIQSGADRDGSDGAAGALFAAARQAGATQVVDGTLFSTGGGWRLDLRRADVATGAIIGVTSVTGHELFALADTATSQLVTSLGMRAALGSVSGVTTRSEAAYKLYSEGLRRQVVGDLAGAEPLFLSALREDSTFALAALYSAMVYSGNSEESLRRWHLALDLSRGVSERERLIIRAGWAQRVSSPLLGTYADSLVTRFPQETEGHLYLGYSRLNAGDFLGAIAPLERVTAMDSLGLKGQNPRCAACEALYLTVSAWIAADSLDQAERVTRRLVRLRPESANNWLMLVGVLQSKGKLEESIDVFRKAQTNNSSLANIEAELLASRHIWLGEYDKVPEVLASQLKAGGLARQRDALFLLGLSLRHAGKYDSALATARRLRALQPDPSQASGSASRHAVLEALILWEMGRAREGAALFDSVSKWNVPFNEPSTYARQRAWQLTHAADAWATAGDTVRLKTAIDSVEYYGARSGLGRDQKLHHFLRGLLAKSRGNAVEAEREFVASVWSRSVGYTRANEEIARLRLAHGDRAGAVPWLEAGLRGAVEGSTLYVRRENLRALLRQALIR